ncbi:2-octaprenyl-6-methoxyphenyl hydroxylase [Candidatus Blochmannia ocreatus (nom. nud.)]|uniref:2-octaprenyl-6-methoxyphenyl hydroxylase n=1 Tax=Candidatus Blochmannia ocreatus (nom. nud.) TaxID=251538 RepID=A0ABY4SZR1_9ENTR|nr:2-octaprenyl-6-methoxyphenyl hydroxylase [Candidatus Blochmannia ocreatus]URJ25324.1 2-octaprenyl-6-methoxyphenyl hydroxylase [Candidatus Blochmannia ocreatus]
MSIVIHGGGMTGAILAFMLHKLTQGNLTISLIDQCSPYTYDMQSSTKTTPPDVVALSRGAYYELIKIDMYPMLNSCTTAIKKIEINAHNQNNTVFINATDYNLSELGYVIELNTFRKNLFDFLYKKSNVNIFCPATLKTIKREKKNNLIILNNDHQIISKLVIAADGSQSKLATNCGIQWFKKNYHQIAIMAKISTEIPHHGCAFEKFTEYGPLAILPTSNNFSYLIWCISYKEKKNISKWNTHKLSQEFQKIFGQKLGKILNIGTQHFHNLWLIYAKNHISHRLALVGNAAQKLHPIAGQGLNLGLRDIVILSKIIKNALNNNIDIGDYSVLSTYQKYRLSDQRSTILFTDGLIRLFSNHCLPVIIARNMGLFLISCNSYLRNLLVYKMLNWKTNQIS